MKYSFTILVKGQYADSKIAYNTEEEAQIGLDDLLAKLHFYGVEAEGWLRLA